MKYKLLLTGKYTTIIDTFFNHLTQYECITTSSRYDDMARHVELYHPDILVVCLQDEDPAMFKRIGTLMNRFSEEKFYVFIIGEDEECADFQKKTGALANREIHKPLSPAKISKLIDDYMIDHPRSNRNQEEDAGLPYTDSGSSKPQKQETEEEKLMRILQSIDEEDLSDATPPAGSDQQSSVDSLSQNDSSASKKHILVIDDDPLMLKVIKDYLHDDYDIATAKGGKIAYKFLEKKKTDLILLDYEMPEEDGPTVYKKIRALPGMEQIPILFLTGVSDKTRIMSVLALKPQGYLLKPIDYATLISTITPILKE
ncbi:MAG: response regulator [Lachnospiraceae bacterium]|nr:response regulator [Lachnospiraceae bacterium]